MYIGILQVAATKDKSLSALEKEFEKRMSAFAKLETITVQASKSDNREKAQAEERDKILAKLNKDAYIIALDELGKEMNSVAFANLIKEQRDFGPGKIQFIIGGSNGLHPDIRAAASQILALSKMTFTHEMVRVFLKEQLYRAFTILAGKRYHK